MESAFQFTNPSLIKLEFEINDGFDVKRDEEIEFNINMSVNVNKNPSANEAHVELIFASGEIGETAPFYICAIEAAHFRWDASLEDGFVDELLHQNAPSLLLAYLRPIVAQITMASPYDAYNIPFINFTQMEKD